MTQKERLVDLLKGCPDNDVFMFDGDLDLHESLADYLLQNGVIVPPCKVGDTVYAISPDCEYQYVADCDASCTFCEHRRSRIETWTVKSLFQVIIVLQSWGTRCFSTYEAAEQALKEREA